MEKLILFGATGSIGSSVLDLVRAHPGRFRLAAVSGSRNLSRLEEIVREFRPGAVGLSEDNPEFRRKFPECVFYTGPEGLSKMAVEVDADTVIMAIAGLAGLLPTIASIKSDKKILSANKEAIVAAGDIVNALLDERSKQIIPLDSEHNAVFNLLCRLPRESVDHIVLTASGGPFRNREVTPDITLGEVLSHPTWDMGAYITVNSATMLNKGFEVIEAHYLFRMDYSKIRVLVHPQSLVHGMVRTLDGTEFMVASPSDMRYPIGLAMFYPEFPPNRFPPLSLAGKTLEFDEVPEGKFPLLHLAYDCGSKGGILPAALNAANEEAVAAFLASRLRFIDIPDTVRTTVEETEKITNWSAKPALEEIIEAGETARRLARKRLGLEK